MWAFSDESERADLMLVGVVTVAPGAAVDTRRELRRLLLPGQRRVHTAKESPRRRRALLDVVAALDLNATVFTTRRAPRQSRSDTRRDLIEAACAHVIAAGAVSWTLDNQDPAQAERDRHTIAALLGDARHLVYDHRPSHDEPLLWAIDAIVWAVGAGPPWSRRVDKVTTVKRLAP